MAFNTTQFAVMAQYALVCSIKAGNGAYSAFASRWKPRAGDMYDRILLAGYLARETMTDDALVAAIRRHIASVRDESAYDDAGAWPTVRVIGDFESIGGF